MKSVAGEILEKVNKINKKELEDDFIQRTNNHISLVKHFADILADYLESKGESEKDDANLLRIDASMHDASKFSESEKDGYIWINAYYNLGIDYPSKKEKKLADKAWEHHQKFNNHHPEFWGNCNRMPKYIVAHMIADWKSMEYINPDSMKLFDFWNQVGKVKYKWDIDHIYWIEDFINVLSKEDV